ncbi:MAG: hypothetical protein JXQ73_07365 [Phycisphaerae bacterium]|nr:hypothetical protein [Phycisphaerae bacterium]
MPMTMRRILCEVCGLSYPREMWWNNMGYCPNCDQPYGPNARRLLDLPRMDQEDLDEDADQGPGAPGAEDRYA